MAKMKAVVGGSVAVLLAVSCLCARGAEGEGEAGAEFQRPVHEGSMFLVSPLFGWNKNELKVPARGRMPAMTLDDTGEEYGVFAMWASPRVVVNDMAFMTRANDADISGNVFFLNVYGEPESTLTWNAGVGHVWHEIDAERQKITVNVPMIKAGLVFRCPITHVSLNPYLAYAWEDTDTTSGGEKTESILYGLTAKWYWRMLHTTVKYYLADDQDRDEQYNVVRARVAFFFNERVGALVRFEYMEHETSDDTSVLVGPAFVF